MRLHTNTLSVDNVRDATYGPRVDVWQARHADGRDWCGKSYNVPREARTDAATPMCVDGKRLTWELDKLATARDSALALPGVDVDVTARGSRSHARSLDVYLTGTSSRRPNNRGNGDDYAATWDEWGMFLARLFAADPDMVAGTVANPIYACAAHFHWATGSRFYSLTPDKQHRNHRWEYGGEAIAGGFTVSGCTCGPNPCGAYRRTLPYGGSWTTSPVSADVTGAHR